MATSSTTFDVANDTLATYRLLAERREGLAANSWPATTRETVSFLLGMADDQCDLLARVGDLADAVRLQGVESLPEEVRPECELVVEHYLALPDASALRFATQARVDLLARALARPDSEINSDPNAIAMLDEPFGAQYLRLENAVGLLYNQVQNYNAKSWTQSGEKAAQAQGIKHDTAEVRRDDGPATRTVTFDFDHKTPDADQPWWRRLFNKH